MEKNKGYSHKYQHKTSQGKRLEIKNDVVYVDGEIAPKGYRWFDKNNNVTYRVGADGKWVPTRDNKGRLLYNSIPQNTARPDWRGRHRAFFQEDTHLESIPEEELKPFDKLFIDHQNKVKSRLNDEENFFIPMYLPGVKIANPKNSYAFNGVNIPYNALDSLYKWSGNKQRFIDALGLAKETSFMKFPSVRSSLTNEEYNIYQKNPEYNNVQDVDRSFGYYPTDLLNNHHYYNNTPYVDEASALIKQNIIDGQLPFAKGSSSFFPDLNGISDDAQQRAADDIPYTKQRPHNTNPLTDALNYLYTANYGMGRKYRDDVTTTGLQLFNDPGLSDWKKSRGIKYRE